MMLFSFYTFEWVLYNILLYIILFLLSVAFFLFIKNINNILFKNYINFKTLYIHHKLYFLSG